MMHSACRCSSVAPLQLERTTRNDQPHQRPHPCQTISLPADYVQQLLKDNSLGYFVRHSSSIQGFTAATSTTSRCTTPVQRLHLGLPPTYHSTPNSYNSPTAYTTTTARSSVLHDAPTTFGTEPGQRELLRTTLLFLFTTVALMNNICFHHYCQY